MKQKDRAFRILMAIISVIQFGYCGYSIYQSGKRDGACDVLGRLPGQYREVYESYCPDASRDRK